MSRACQLLLLSIALCNTGHASEVLRAEQRLAFKAAYAEAERGNWEGMLPFQSLLQDYVLYPDLEGRALRATLSQQSPQRLKAFLTAHSGHPERRLIADAWLRQLANQQRWDQFRSVWERFGSARPDAELACLALQARMDAAVDDELIQAALARWQVGISQPRACDPVFALLKAHGALTPQRYQARLALALEQKQFGLAQFLARQLNPAAVRQVAGWRQMYADPAAGLATLPVQPDSVDERKRALTGLLKLAYRDGAGADRELSRLTSHYAFSATDHAAVARQIALGKAQRHEPDAWAALRRVPAKARDATISHWQLRTALRTGRWDDALRGFSELADEDARSDQWQYWLARSRAAVGDQDAADQIFASLAQQRSLYGFLSADRVNLPYAFDHQPTPADPSRQQQLAATPELLRARELFMVGLLGRGRTLWERSIRQLSQDELAQTALLAHGWGWHSRAISTAAKAGLFDDLELRYPLPRVAWTRQLNQSQRVDQPYALGITRSESLFMPDVRSSAGAIGLMQLMPATGRSVARSLNLPYRGLATLTDPGINVQLGTAYLEQMLDRFAENKVLATAAYNAGPHRVERWLPDDQLAADIWMDSIPFTETRRYVRRVLESQAIVRWRLGGQAQPVSNMMRPVRPASLAGARSAGSP